MNREQWQSARTQEFENQIKALAGRDSRLWSVGLVVLLLFSTGFLAVALPNLIWGATGLRMDTGHVVQLAVAVFMLILVFSGYVLDQKRSHHKTRQELIREMVFSERMQSFSLIDPVTQIFNRHYLDQVLPREVNRANRYGSRLTFLMLQVESWAKLTKHHGELISDQLLIESAQLLKSTFRGSDVVLRYGQASFLVLLPETDECQANCALRRLFACADRWNLETEAPYEIAFNGGLTAYQNGLDVDASLQTLERNIRSHGPTSHTAA